MKKQYTGFVVLLEGKILSWGVGEMPPYFPNYHVDPEFFSGSTYDRMLSFCMNERLDPQPKPKRAKTTVRRFRVNDLSEFKERIKSFNLHPDFVGYDLISDRLILRKRRVHRN